MMQTEKVPFDKDIIGRCLCPGCPVQAGSDCVAGLRKDLEEALNEEPLQSEKIPGVYCAAGKAACSDIDTNQGCLCFGCPVYLQYRLETRQPLGYYCRDGVPD